MHNPAVIETVAEAIYAVDYPSGVWDDVKPENRRRWRAMARTVVSVSLWGDFVDAAKRLAHWDDVDHKRALKPFAEKTPAAQRMWMKRAESGFAALEKLREPADG